MYVCAALLLLPVLAQATVSSFSPGDAIRAEWQRRPPALGPAAQAALPKADRERLQRSLARIGAPLAITPALLPPEPDVAGWEAAVRRARTPEERYQALHMLNRKKAAHPLIALAGLTPEDARRWPRHLHLEGQVAAARLLGDTVSAEVQAFLGALPEDPVRAQAARLRLVLGGKEAALMPPLAPTPGAVLALLSAWDQGPWERRAATHLQLLAFAAGVRGVSGPALFAELGLKAPAPALPRAAWVGLLSRLLEGLPDPAPEAAWPAVAAALGRKDELLVRLAALGALGKFTGAAAQAAARAEAEGTEARVLMALLPSLRRLDPGAADRLGGRLLAGADGIARGAAIDDRKAPPARMDQLVTRLLADTDIDGLQALIRALPRWQVPPPSQRQVLERFLRHRTWIHRYEAWQALSALAPGTPWPAAPAPTPAEQVILAEAERLAAPVHNEVRPVRLQLQLSLGRRITLRLDPGVAPINVANLVVLARKGFFDGLTFHRIVPDFVVQGGDPRGTGDGGPGYAVRCEDSLVFYGPGSVGMALSGKDTGGSQFFITTNAAPHLIGKYTHLGFVEDPDRALPLLDDLELGARIERAVVLP